MKDRRLAIKEALESIKAAERAQDFENLAVHLAKRRWPELVATEAKKDAGADAISFQRGADGKRCNLACSLTGTLAKIQDDARRQKECNIEADVLVFLTTEAIANLTVTDWKRKFREEFGHDLEFFGQAEVISELEKPENDWLCVRYLRLDPHAPDLRQLQNLIAPLQPYLEKVADDCRYVTLLGIDKQAGDVTDPTTPELAAVYIQLLTTESKPRPASERDRTKGIDREFFPAHSREIQDEPLAALEAIFDEARRRTVILGAPGSGKSTLFRHLSLCLASQHFHPHEDWLKDLPGEFWKAAPPIPVWIQLRRFAAHFANAKPPTGSSQQVWEFMADTLEKSSLSAVLPALEAALEHGHALVLFDGLDEVPDAMWAFVRESIESFARGGFRKSRIVGTCRVKSYEPRGLKLAEFQDFTLREFTTEQSRAFIHRWYEECAAKGKNGMTAEDAAQCIPSLVAALDNPHLAEMASNPMHLTAMACLHTARAGQPLPEESAKLYEQLVDTLLFLWDKTKKAKGEEQIDELAALLNAAKCDEKRLRSTLDRLAFAAQQGDSRGAADAWKATDITEDTLKLELQKLHPEESGTWAKAVIEAIRHRAGLLQSDDGKKFQFTYRFQEFLAGAFLANESEWPPAERGAERKPFHQRAAEFFDPGEYWRNVILWAAGIKAHVRVDCQHEVRDLVHELSKVSTPPDAFERRKLILAADITRELRVRNLLATHAKWGRETHEQLQAGLQAAFRAAAEDRSFPIQERALLAAQFGWVEDPRAGVGLKADSSPAVPDFAWCGPAPGKPFFPGPFEMGGDPEAYGSSPEPFSCTRIKFPFFIARYPVTVAQFQAFVDDQGGGYLRDDLWTPAGLLWRDGQGAASVWEGQRDEYLQGPFPIRGPKSYSAEFQTPNHPRVGGELV